MTAAATIIDSGRNHTEVQAVLAATERPSMLISTVITHHLCAAVAGVASVAAVLFAAVDAASTETVGVGSVVALIIAVMGVVFRTQQQQIRSQRVDMARMARRIEHLEAELDARRLGDTAG